MVQIPGRFVGGVIVYDDDDVSRIEITDVDAYAPVANCGAVPG